MWRMRTRMHIALAEKRSLRAVVTIFFSRNLTPLDAKFSLTFLCHAPSFLCQTPSFFCQSCLLYISHVIITKYLRRYATLATKLWSCVALIKSVLKKVSKAITHCFSTSLWVDKSLNTPKEQWHILNQESFRPLQNYKPKHVFNSLWQIANCINYYFILMWN